MAEPKYASKDRNVCSDGTPVGTWRTKPEPITDATVAGEADVIVVGHGYAGITACREIAEEGHSVILLEKQYEDMFAVMGNEAATVNASYMLEIGAPEIDINEYFTNWMMMAGWTVNPDLIMKFAQNSGANSDWYFDVCTHDEIASDTSVKYHYTGNFRFPEVDEGYLRHVRQRHADDDSRAQPPEGHRPGCAVLLQPQRRTTRTGRVGRSDRRHRQEP